MSNVRDRLIEATFEEIFTTSYSAASLANILNRAEVKKGAMYHYFPSKKAMVLAMIDEMLEKRIEKRWLCLLDTKKDEIDLIISILTNKKEWDLINGCPLGNLLQEPLDQDKDFADILNAILNKWKSIFIQALQKAKDKNLLNENVNIKQCATFLIASIEGAILLSKKSKDTKDFDDCTAQLVSYLNSLKKVNY
jgi:TetR/AcrR family transcriptional regulator, transcriptional repressor for nem operon